MKTVNIFFYLLIFLAWSCTENNDEDVKINPRPPGKYLSEIRVDDLSHMPDNSMKAVEFKYDENRYLKTINFYIPENQHLQKHFDLFYDTDGLLKHIESNYSASNAMIDERFTYENKKLVKIEGYKIEDSKTTLVGRTDFKVNDVTNTVEINTYQLVEGLLVKDVYPQKYYFNSNGNLVKYHYNIGKGGYFETMEDYEYDNMVSPFANLGIPYYNIVSSYLTIGECFSANNVVKYNRYLYENGVSYKIPAFDSIVYKYEGNFPVQSAEFGYNGKTLVKSYPLNFYKYIDLK